MSCPFISGEYFTSQGLQVIKRKRVPTHAADVKRASADRIRVRNVYYVTRSLSAIQCRLNSRNPSNRLSHTGILL